MFGKIATKALNLGSFLSGQLKHIVLIAKMNGTSLNAHLVAGDLKKWKERTSKTNAQWKEMPGGKRQNEKIRQCSISR